MAKQVYARLVLGLVEAACFTCELYCLTVQSSIALDAIRIGPQLVDHRYSEAYDDIKSRKSDRKVQPLCSRIEMSIQNRGARVASKTLSPSFNTDCNAPIPERRCNGWRWISLSIVCSERIVVASNGISRPSEARQRVSEGTFLRTRNSSPTTVLRHHSCLSHMILPR